MFTRGICRQRPAAFVWAAQGGGINLHGIFESIRKIIRSWRVAILARAALWGGDRSYEVVLTRRTWSVAKSVIIARTTLKRRCRYWEDSVVFSGLCSLCRGKEVRDEARHDEKGRGAGGRVGEALDEQYLLNPLARRELMKERM